MKLRDIWEIRLVRFAFSGGLNTLFGWVCFSVAILLGAPWVVAIIVGAVLSIGFSFLTQGGLTFRDLSLQRLPKFIGAYGIIIAVNYALLWLLRITDYGPILIQLLILPILAVLSYLLFSRFVFR